MTIERVTCYLQNAGVGNTGNTTVTLSHGSAGGNLMATVTISATDTDLSASTTNIASGSRGSANHLVFAITSVGSDVQGLSVNMLYRRNV